MRSLVTRVVLVLLISIGFWGSLSVSYVNFTGEQACPNLAGLAICYVVAIAYGSMLASQFSRHNLHHAIFLGAWGITFLIAMFGSGLELVHGGQCPVGALQLPLCYVSLALCLSIFGIYRVARPARV